MVGTSTVTCVSDFELQVKLQHNGTNEATKWAHWWSGGGKGGRSPDNRSVLLQGDAPSIIPSGISFRSDKTMKNLTKVPFY